MNLIQTKIQGMVEQSPVSLNKMDRAMGWKVWEKNYDFWVLRIQFGTRSFVYYEETADQKRSGGLKITGQSFFMVANSTTYVLQLGIRQNGVLTAFVAHDNFYPSPKKSDFKLEGYQDVIILVCAQKIWF